MLYFYYIHYKPTYIQHRPFRIRFYPTENLFLTVNFVREFTVPIEKMIKKSDIDED